MTAGSAAIYSEGDWLVPKKDLVGDCRYSCKAVGCIWHPRWNMLTR
jgi:hypothetical protein